MANQVSARIAGDDYQHLYAWHHILRLKRPHDQVRAVCVEDPDGASVDDVTVCLEPNTAGPDAYYQVKFHVSQARQYSTNELLARKPNSRSLLQKFWDTWRHLRNNERTAALYLVSNWSWSQDDPIGVCLSGLNDGLRPSFFTSGARTEIGRLRQAWQEHLDAAPLEFRAFARCLCFKLGHGCWNELQERVAERMEHLRLRHDEID